MENTSLFYFTLLKVHLIFFSFVASYLTFMIIDENPGPNFLLRHDAKRRLCSYREFFTSNFFLSVQKGINQ